MRQLASDVIAPLLAQMRKVIGLSVRSLMETVTTLAVDPIGVPFPPNPTPRARAHHSGVTFTPWLCNPAMIGSMAMVNGMLSTTADMIALIHRTDSTAMIIPCSVNAPI